MSAELESLQALIETLSADIDLQKTVLKDLEHRKSAAQGVLNAIRDPMARLPLEISSEIFLWQCTPDSLDSRPPKPNAREGPMLLLNVCKAWSAIAVSTPMLWNNINIDVPGAKLLLDAWLRRANKCPVSITLSHQSLNDGVSVVLGKHAERVKCMEITEGKERFGTEHAMPSQYILHQVIDHLSHVPNLVECTVHNVFQPDHFSEDILGLPPARIRPVVLPHLLSLDLGNIRTTRSFDGDRILKYLTLPALETLTLPRSPGSSQDVVDFLSRSSPPLQRLDLSDRFRTLSDLDAFLSLFPDLTHLACQGEFVEDFFSALAAAPAFFHPNLRSLEIEHRVPLSAAGYRKVFHALSIRSAQLVRVKLNCGSHHGHPGIDVGHGWQQLVANGMDVHIGTADINFLPL
ncbi:hypothetical protein C8R47DRAFT_1125238 [Mycena vitilis]|nr:hypothetical protein C8R47DRAFT_1125238 [Mycena vitilis]